MFNGLCFHYLLLYSGVSIGVSQAYFGAGSGQIWLRDVGCDGTEASIYNCFTVWGDGGWCKHSEDAGVICDAGYLWSSLIYFYFILDNQN